MFHTAISFGTDSLSALWPSIINGCPSEWEQCTLGSAMPVSCLILSQCPSKDRLFNGFLDQEFLHAFSLSKTDCLHLLLSFFSLLFTPLRPAIGSRSSGQTSTTAVSFTGCLLAAITHQAKWQQLQPLGGPQLPEMMWLPLPYVVGKLFLTLS